MRIRYQLATQPPLVFAILLAPAVLLPQLLLLAIARARASGGSRAGGRRGSRGEDGSGSGLGRSGSGGGGGLRELALLVRELPRRVLLRLLSLLTNNIAR